MVILEQLSMIVLRLAIPFTSPTIPSTSISVPTTKASLDTTNALDTSPSRKGFATKAARPRMATAITVSQPSSAPKAPSDQAKKIPNTITCANRTTTSANASGSGMGVRGARARRRTRPSTQYSKAPTASSALLCD